MITEQELATPEDILCDNLEEADDIEEGDEVFGENVRMLWQPRIQEPSQAEFHGRIFVPPNGTQPWYKTLPHYLGPGALVAVGYMDPGNWSTSIAGGSAFGFKLLWVIALSSAMAMFLQVLSLKCGLATGCDLAQVCREAYPKPVVLVLWVIMELAIVATGKLFL